MIFSILLCLCMVLLLLPMTAKAMEIGEIEGAMSSLSIAVAGLITVVGSTIFYQLY